MNSALRMEGSALSLPWQAPRPGIDGAMPSITERTAIRPPADSRFPHPPPRRTAWKAVPTRVTF